MDIPDMGRLVSVATTITTTVMVIEAAGECDDPSGDSGIWQPATPLTLPADGGSAEGNPTRLAHELGLADRRAGYDAAHRRLRSGRLSALTLQQFHPTIMFIGQITRTPLAQIDCKEVPVFVGVASPRRLR